MGNHCRDLVEVRDDRPNSGITPITDLLHVSQWNDSIAYAAMASVIPDRFVQPYFRRELKDESPHKQQDLDASAGRAKVGFVTAPVHGHASSNLADATVLAHSGLRR